ncbi:MAG TPA: hypothetical protein VFU59_11345 [Candidatus Eisenbacteria bacterium]|nr:hypothetical protein [Candidatus Eisenbacteria bacterium]
MRFGPLVVTFVTGATLIAIFFIPHHSAQQAQSVILEWADVVYAFALLLGSIVLWTSHWKKATNFGEGWFYSAVTLVALTAVTLLGIFLGVGGTTPVGRIYDAVNAPLASTMFSLLAFFIASAAFRAFRARNFEATLLLLTAIVMMFGRVSIGEYVWSAFPPITEWLLDVPNLAAKRAVAIGVGLGAVSTALKIILGIDRSYLGRA